MCKTIAFRVMVFFYLYDFRLTIEKKNAICASAFLPCYYWPGITHSRGG